MKLQELEKKYEELCKAHIELGKEIEKLKSSDDKKMLRHCIYGNDLLFYYGKKDEIFINMIGHITESGRLYILNANARLDNYGQWIKDGKPTDHDTVSNFNGGEYQINGFYRLVRIDIKCGTIYNFNDDETVENCEDTNIIRHEHNGRPIRF